MRHVNSLVAEMWLKLQLYTKIEIHHSPDNYNPFGEVLPRQYKSELPNLKTDCKEP